MTALPIFRASTAAPVFLAEQEPSTGGVGFWLFSVFIMSLWVMGLTLMPRMWRAGAALRAQMDDSLQALGPGGSSLLLRAYVPAIGFMFGAWLVIVGIGLSDNPGAWNARISQWSSDIGVVLIALSVVLAGTIALFNRPRFLVMPHLRAHRGAVGEAIARLRRLSAREGEEYIRKGECIGPNRGRVRSSGRGTHLPQIVNAQRAGAAARTSCARPAWIDR